MSAHDDRAADIAVERAALQALSSDDWAELLVALRAELTSREDLDAQQRAVVEQPTSRLVAGRGRDRVVDLLTADARLTAMVLRRVPPAVRASLDAAAPAVTGDPAAGGRDAEVARVRRRARALREARETWRRRAEGAEARAEQTERELAAQAAAQRELREMIAELRAELAESDAERERAVTRERRRRDAEVARLEGELAALRRAEESRRAERVRRERAAERRATGGPEAAEPAPAPRAPPGRPTRLPPDIVAGTTEAARALLGPGRLVLIDGYNVTLNHRADLDLEAQRNWLIGVCANAVPIQRIRPVIVFDGQHRAGGRAASVRQPVEVRFTPEGITADDELVLAVEATDEPVVVVTDDRELAGRVASSGADVIGTVSFLGVVRR